MAGQTLGAAVVDITANMQPLKNEMGGWKGEAEQHGIEIGSSFALGFASPVLNAMGAVQQLTGSLREAADFGSRVTGVGISGRYQMLEVGLRSLTGTATAAKQELMELTDIGQHTSFRTEVLVSYAQELQNVGVTAQNVKGDLMALVDSAAAGGKNAAQLGEMVRVMTTLRRLPRIDQQVAGELASYVNLPAIIGAATGRQGLTPQQASSVLAGLGPKAYDTLIKGMEIVYKGAAERQSKTFLGQAETASESIELAFKPTGDHLLPILTKVVGVTQSAAEKFEHLNEATGGGAGLVAIVTLATGAIQKWGGSLIAGVGATRNLTNAITDYAIAAQAAASIKPPTATGTGIAGIAGAGISTGAETAAGAAGAAGLAASAGKVVGPAIEAIPENAFETAFKSMGMVNIGSKAIDVFAIGKSIGTGLISLLPLGVSLGLGYLSSRYAASGNEHAANIAGGAGQGVGIGTLIGTIAGGALGAAAGFFFEGIGAIPGAVLGSRWGGLLGGAIGGGIGAYTGSHQQVTAAVKTANAADKMAAAADKMTTAINNFHSSVYGGGTRARNAIEALDAEYALARSYAGQAG